MRLLSPPPGQRLHVDAFVAKSGIVSGKCNESRGWYGVKGSCQRRTKGGDKAAAAAAAIQASRQTMADRQRSKKGMSRIYGEPAAKTIKGIRQPRLMPLAPLPPSGRTPQGTKVAASRAEAVASAKAYLRGMAPAPTPAPKKKKGRERGGRGFGA